MGKEQYSHSDFAVLYRINAQSRILEEALRKYNVPYRIYGGVSFYHRKEIKDVIAYLRMIVNPHDEEALKRIINYPARGIGETTVGKIAAAATEHNVSLWDIVKDPLSYPVRLSSATVRRIETFRLMMENFMEQNIRLQADEITSLVLKETGIINEFMQERSAEATGRIENLEELLKGISQYIQSRLEEDSEGNAGLAGFLSEISLLTDQDNDKDKNENKVTLMTVHAAKGLEFKNVFVAGVEEDLLPSSLAKDSPHAIEEERRLFYVAITRAEENCILTYAQSRFRNGKVNMSSPSRFLQDIDAQYLDAPLSFHHQPVQAPVPSSPPSAPSPPPRLTKVKEMYDAIPATAPAPAPDNSGVKVGDTVQHERFGKGKVTHMEGEGGNIKATVVFENFGQKQLLLKYARLTIL
jgi:DNA helicase-2/ATP-dependent DNA helicase PcrA